MPDQLPVILPVEVSELASKVSEAKQTEIKNVLNSIFSGTSQWEAQVDTIEVKDIHDTMSITLAETARKNAKTARLNAEKIFDAKRAEVQQLKAEYDIEDKLWLKAKQVAQIKFKGIEEKAEWKANFVKRYEAEQKELRTQKRELEVAQYAELNRIEFENMSEDSYNSFLSGLKATHEAKVAAEKKAEEERIAKEKKEAEEREAQRLENERLKKEAEEKEKQLEEERAEAAAKIAEEQAKAKAEKDAADKKLAEERAERERIQSELNAQKAKEEADKLAKAKEEEANRKAAEKLAKAPIKKQMAAWVNSFTLPTAPSSDISAEIEAKFEAFKAWALTKVETI